MARHLPTSQFSFLGADFFKNVNTSTVGIYLFVSSSKITGRPTCVDQSRNCSFAIDYFSDKIVSCHRAHADDIQERLETTWTI